MKKHRKVIAVLLTAALLTGLVCYSAGADGGTLDLDGDGRITIHDVQLAQEADEGLRTLTEEQTEKRSGYSVLEMLNKLFEKPHVPEKDGQTYLIANAKDLAFLQENSTKGYSFKLTNDIDLEGADWEPIDRFSGEFDGNGKTISNLVITTGQKNSNRTDTVKDLENQGFFAEILSGATVKNLNLEYVEITASADAMFIGLLAGTNRGKVLECYTHGKITDRRKTVTVRDGGTKIAALVGRNVEKKENNTVVDGYYTTVSDRVAAEPIAPGTDSKYVLRNGKDPDADPIPVAAQLAVDVADREDITVCLSYNAPKDSTVTQFQEISGSYGVSEAMQIKQDKVVDYMYQEGTVKWTTDTALQYYKTEGQTTDPSVWNANTTMYGIPFTDMHNNLERFLYVTEDTDGDGILELNGELANVEDPDWYTSRVTNYYEGAKDYGRSGWIRYLGNDCSSAIAWAWNQISPISTFEQSDGIAESYAFHTETGVFAESCRHVFPIDELDADWNNHYGHKHNIVKIGEYDFFETDEEGNTIKTFLDAETAAKTDANGDGVISAKLDGKCATTSANLWEWNADNSKTADNEKYAKLYATYGQARKGDAIHCWFTGDAKTTFSEDTNGNDILDEGEDQNGNNDLDKELPDRVWEGHMRLLAEDPVIIRNWNGYVDIESSYVITHGHGGGVASRKTNASNTWSNANAWYLYNKYFLTDLDYTVGDCTNANDSSRCYLPITCPALRQETTVEALTESIKWSTSQCTTPYSGKIRSSQALSSVQVEVFADSNCADSLGKYTACAIPEGGLKTSLRHARHTPEYLRDSRLDWLFPNLQSDLAAVLTDGQTYYFKITVHTVNDEYRLDSTTGQYEWVEDTAYTSNIHSFVYETP